MPSDWPSNWTQQSSNALKALARTALTRAENALEQWVNPTPLNSKVRYVRNTMQFEVYGARDGKQYRTLGYYFRDDAQDFLFWCWVNEIRYSGNTKYVDDLTLYNEIGIWK